MTERIVRNARIVLADEVITGSLAFDAGGIRAIDASARGRTGDDLEGDYLIPGLVELHTDHLESHYHPRPGVDWPATSAIIAHDAQIAAAGITTVFDALRAGTFDPGDHAGRSGAELAGAIGAAQARGQLRAEHFIHVRCELPCPDTVEAAERLAGAGEVRLMSLMDHTPGWRQFVSIDKFKEYYLGKKLILPERIEDYIAERIALQRRHAEANKRGILALARETGARLASHDDATPGHVAEAIDQGAVIAEFPTSREATSAARGAGLKVLMGAPNLVRGGSHSGNISAETVAAAGELDILSSDYVPASLLLAAFALPERLPAIRLPEALAFVSRKPAEAAGLTDRGEIAEGKRADLVHVALRDGHPVVRRVWRAGQRVL